MGHPVYYSNFEFLFWNFRCFWTAAFLKPTLWTLGMINVAWFFILFKSSKQNQFIVKALSNPLYRTNPFIQTSANYMKYLHYSKYICNFLLILCLSIYVFNSCMDNHPFSAFICVILGGHFHLDEVITKMIFHFIPTPCHTMHTRGTFPIFYLAYAVIWYSISQYLI